MRYPIYRLIYDTVQLKGSASLDDIEQIVKMAGIEASRNEILRALMYLELNGLVHVERRRRGNTYSYTIHKL